MSDETQLLIFFGILAFYASGFTISGVINNCPVWWNRRKLIWRELTK